MLAKQAVYVKTELEIILKIVNISNHFSTQNKQAPLLSKPQIDLYF